MERQECEVYSRVCGYMRPTSQWNEGKQEEFKDRTTFDVSDIPAGSSQKFE